MKESESDAGAGGKQAPARVGGIVLAAGRSRRMGRPKPLLDARGRSFVERAVEALRRGGCDPVVVVVDPELPGVVGRAESAGARVVVNANPGPQPLESLRLGLRALGEEVEAALVLPVDHPLVSAGTVASLRSAFAEHRAVALRPTYRGAPGHPTVFGRALFPELLAGELPEGARSVLARHAGQVEDLPVDDPGVVADVDTTADYERFLGRPPADAPARAPAAEPGAADAAADTPDAEPGALDATASAPDAAAGPAGTGATRGAAEPARPSAAGPLDAARAALDAAAGGPAAAVIVVIESPAGAGVAPGERWVLRSGGGLTGPAVGPELADPIRSMAERLLAGGGPRTESVEAGGERYVLYGEAQHPPEDLVIVGAGHIAVPLAHVGALLGFRVMVLDDREEFATRKRFPDAAAVIRADFADPFRDVPIGARSYVVLVTRGHKYDFDCLGRLLAHEPPPRYMGLIGSRRRIRAAFRALLKGGVARDRLSAVHAPVGMDIGAETPEEIAVSIAAELVMVRRGGGAEEASLARRERVLERLLPEGEDEDDG